MQIHGFILVFARKLVAGKTGVKEFKLYSKLSELYRS